MRKPTRRKKNEQLALKCLLLCVWKLEVFTMTTGLRVCLNVAGRDSRVNVAGVGAGAGAGKGCGFR